MTGRIFRLPAGAAFADGIAAGLLRRTQDNPLALADMLVLLPTRRACRTLRQSFLRQSSGRALLLPRLMPLGDLDADELLLTAGLSLPPAISVRARQLILARLIRQHGDATLPTPQLLTLARALGTLLDDFTLEDVEISRLDTLVPESLASHWQTTLFFLQPIVSAWQRELADRGLLDPADRRNRLLLAQARAWQDHPPSHPVIAAGSTGSIPATANLLKVVSALPQGSVVLPGLPALPDWWEQVDATHPLHELRQLLIRLDVTPDQVQPWPDTPDSHTGRLELLHHALLPAACSNRWAEPRRLDGSGLTRIDCASEQEEATVIALAMRAQLEQPGATAMLVTPDRTLGRRVGSLLQRWEIGVDDSAGVPLHKTESATFLRALLAWSAEPTLASWLALMKHPMAAMGLTMSDCRQRVRQLELATRRSRQPARTLDQLIAGTEEHQDWLQQIAGILTPLMELRTRPQIALDEALLLFLGAAEDLASTDTTPGTQRLWRGEAGTALAQWVADLLAHADELPLIRTDELDETLLGLMSDVVVRPRYGEHPRLSILGPLEARLQQADLVILGGLNEGSWPAPPEPDPWLSRPMRKELGLKTPEERLGQEAHDFYTLAAAPRVLLTRALRQAGTPTVPARWLSRLATVLRDQSSTEATDWLALARAIDRPDAIAPAAPPEPRPPAAARPRDLSVTEIETLLRDPYAVYARRILGLSPLQPLEPDIGAAERGTFYHLVLQQFRREFPDALPVDMQAHLHRIGEEQLERLGLGDQRTLWWPRFADIIRWYEQQERARTGTARPLAQEVKGQLVRDSGFTVTARADRIDRCSDSSLEIIDYKTGRLPEAREIRRGLSAQLPLEAAIAQAGGFAGIAAAPVSALSWWHLTGRKGEPGTIVPFVKDATGLQPAIDDALTQLDDAVRWFADEHNPYLSEPDAAFRPRFSDYSLLARVKEWAVSGGEEEA